MLETKDDSTIGESVDSEESNEIDETISEVAPVEFAWVDEFYWLDSHNNATVRSRTEVWARDIESEGFAQELIREEPVGAGAGLQVINLTIPFGFTKGLEDPRLITRPNTRAIYDAAFSMIIHRAPCHILVEGAPGVGKSRNLIYLLKLLLGENRKVIFHCAKEYMVYVFIPPIEVLGTHSKADAPSNRYRCYTISENSFQDTPGKNLTKDPRNVYLYDPRHDGEPPQVQCSMLIAASPNIRHYANFIKGNNAKLFKINPFLYVELEAFFAALYPPTKCSYSRLAPTGDTGDTFQTKLGRVLCQEENLPLCGAHLQYGFYEVIHVFYYILFA